ncbi:GNAT family N-acetyltransferase [Pontibacter sp. MBLB2868]|uniref:GNAT family N-acetyltransferase n=1 Tax=Pontibacter sp. MBLB2868 TaxID=3451555 RepID=UPI003F750ABE
MSIAYLQHHAIDKIQWDALITQSPEGQVYALSWYLDVVSPAWEAVVQLDEEGKYRIVMPVPWLKKLGVRYIQQPLFCQQLGVYSINGSIAEAVYNSFIKELEHRFRYVTGYQFNTSNKLPAAPQQEHTFTLYLHLNKPYEQLQQRYTRDRKQNLKRAQKAGLRIIESEDMEPLITFFRTETAGRIYGGVSEEAYAQLRELYAALKTRGLARLYYTLDQQERKNAGCLFIIWRNRIVYIFNAAAGHGRKQNGRTLMLDHVIREYSNQEFILDFESPDESEPDIVNFYRSFGAEAMPIPVLKYNHLPQSIKLVREVRMRLVQRLKGK